MKIAIAAALSVLAVGYGLHSVVEYAATTPKTAQEVCRSAEFLSVFVWDKRAIEACQPYRDADPSFTDKQAQFWRLFEGAKAQK